MCVRTISYLIGLKFGSLGYNIWGIIFDKPSDDVKEIKFARDDFVAVGSSSSSSQ